MVGSWSQGSVGGRDSGLTWWLSEVLKLWDEEDWRSVGSLGLEIWGCVHVTVRPWGWGTSTCSSRAAEVEAIEGIRIKEVLSSCAKSTSSSKRFAKWENLFYSEARWLDSESRGLDEDWFTWSVWGKGSVGPIGGVGNSIIPISVWWRIVSAWRVFSPAVLTGLLLAFVRCLGVLRVTNIHGPRSQVLVSVH